MCRFCDLVFQGPLSVQEDWIKHLQRHIMNTAVPHTGAGMVEVTSFPKDSCPNTIPQAQPSVMHIPSWAQEHTKFVLGISLVCKLFGSHLNFILPSVSFLLLLRIHCYHRPLFRYCYFVLVLNIVKKRTNGGWICWDFSETHQKTTFTSDPSYTEFNTEFNLSRQIYALQKLKWYCL